MELVKLNQGQSVVSNVTTDRQLLALWVRGKSPTTKEYYIDDATRFLAFTEKTVQEITLEDVFDFQDSLLETGDAETTNYRRMCVVKSLLTFAHNIGYTRFNVGRAVELNTPKDTLGERIVDPETVFRVIDGAGNERNRLILSTLYFAGVRASEIIKLHWRDLEGGVLTVHGKGGKTRHVKLPKRLCASLAAYRGEAGADTPIFPSTHDGSCLTRQSVWHVVKNAKKAANVSKEVSPHWFRHAHVSHALNNGAPMHVVQQTVGHAHLETTSRYTHVRPDQSSGDYL